MKTQLSEERISMRTNLDTKRFLEAAAILSGYNNLSGFILTTVYKEAQRIINDSQGRVLSDRDRDLVLNLLNTAPEPNAKLTSLLLNAAKDDSLG
jgi:uncharacterized protein (DUF1778 family)